MALIKLKKKKLNIYMTKIHGQKQLWKKNFFLKKCNQNITIIFHAALNYKVKLIKNLYFIDCNDWRTTK